MFLQAILYSLRYIIIFLFTIVCTFNYALSADKIPLVFYFPVAASGSITKIIENMTSQFMKEHPHIVVKPVYTGSYKDTLIKSLTALRGSEPPQLAVLLSTDLFSLLDENLIVSFNEFSCGPELGSEFFPAFMENSQNDGKVWGIPFQRSTIVLFWNKEAFLEAGLDPDIPPRTWEELVEFSKKLVKRDHAGNVTQWGVSIPTAGFAYWMFQALCIENGLELMNKEGTKTFFNDPKAIEALQFLVDLSRKYKVMPEGAVNWSVLPKDFIEGKTAMIWTTTGNFTNIRSNASFDLGVAILPKHVRYGSPTGGGNFYIFKRSTPEQRKAAFEFVQWMTSKEQTVQWSIDTGYVAVRPDAWRTDTMKTYVEKYPYSSAAYEQLKYAVAELSTHDNQRVTKALEDAIQAAVNGTKTPKAALDDAQKVAQYILRRYQ